MHLPVLAPQAAFEQVPHTEFPADLGEIAPAGRIDRGGVHVDQLQVGDVAQVLADLAFHTLGEVSVRRVRAEVLERQHRD